MAHICLFLTAYYLYCCVYTPHPPSLLMHFYLYCSTMRNICPKSISYMLVERGQVPTLRWLYSEQAMRGTDWDFQRSYSPVCFFFCTEAERRLHQKCTEHGRYGSVTRWHYNLRKLNLCRLLFAFTVAPRVIVTSAGTGVKTHRQQNNKQQQQQQQQ